MSEKQLLQAVRDLARTLGWLVYHTHDSRRSEPGFPDLVMVRRRRIVFVELKVEKGKTTPAQDEWIDRLVGAGAEVAIWRPSHWHDGVIEKALSFE